MLTLSLRGQLRPIGVCCFSNSASSSKSQDFPDLNTSVDVHEHKLNRPVKKPRKVPKLEDKDKEALRQSAKVPIFKFHLY